MSKKMNFLMRSILSLTFLVFIIGCNAAAAQTEVTGDWTAAMGREKPAIGHRQKSDEPDTFED